MKKILITLVAVIALYWFISPYIALYRIQHALEHNDAARLSRYVNFPHLREQLNHKLQADLKARATGTELPQVIQQMGLQLSEPLVNRLVDLMVRPENLQLILQGRSQLKQLDLNRLVSEQRPQLETKAQASNQTTNYRGGYRSFNRFEVEVQRGEQKLIFILHRHGVYWRISEIDW